MFKYDFILHFCKIRNFNCDSQNRQSDCDSKIALAKRLCIPVSYSLVHKTFVKISITQPNIVVWFCYKHAISV